MTRSATGPMLARVVTGLALALPVVASAQEATTDALFDMSFEELLSLTITTASRRAERPSDAPATVIVLTRDELQRRGYRELSEIYNDLPGMDLTRSYGDTYFRNQWRGLRKTIGTPYLLMVDGVIFNHLYFNQEEIIAALPMSHVEQVEVVYGPASVVYGPNAFVGVINVITRQDRDGDGSQFSGRLTAGSFDTRIIDAHLLHRREQWRFSLALRWDEGDIDRRRAHDYEWTRPATLQDRRLWGGLVEQYGRYQSPHRNRGLDLRLFHGDTEFALQHYTLDTGFGWVYAADRIPPLSFWSEPEWSAHVRHPWQWGESIRGSWLLRYRESGVANDSDTLEGFNRFDAATGRVQRLVNYSYWGVESSSWSLFNDAEWEIDARWSLLGGLKHERKDLQKAYRILYGPDLLPEAIGSVANYPFPDRPTTDLIPRNRIDTRDSALYALGRYRLDDALGGGESQQVFLGVRVDRNSEYGTARTLRGGYVYNRAAWTAKLLYGEAFNEPAPRELYGGWSGSGSNPTLDPETARTLEASLGWQGSGLGLLLSAYQLRSDDNIVTFAGGARNLGERRIQGLDLHLNAKLRIGERSGSLWAYYSWIDAEETAPHDDGSLAQIDVGDTSPHKLHVGTSWSITEVLSGTLRGRYIDARRTVASNPAGRVSSYTTFDLTLQQRDWPRSGLTWALAVHNLTDRRYFHPGLREGDAGFEPGRFDADGVWRGSAGYFNSLMPQDGRGYFLSLQMDF